MEGKTFSDKSQSPRPQVLACFLHPCSSQLPLSPWSCGNKAKAKTLKSKTKELQSYLKPYLLHIVLLQHNEKQEALTLNKGISKSSTTQL
jgi:hypothetical protein